MIMRIVLHVLTRPEDSLARAVLDAQRKDPEMRVREIDLTHGIPNYAQLLEAVFEADSIQVW